MSSPDEIVKYPQVAAIANVVLFQSSQVMLVLEKFE